MALSDVFNDKRRDGVKHALSQAAVKIYRGSLVSINSSGYAVTGTSTASEKFAGVAYETVDNSAGSAGDTTIQVWRQGNFEFNYQGTAAQSDVGSMVWIVDDSTVATKTDATVAVKVLVGVITDYVSTSLVRVDINTNIIS